MESFGVTWWRVLGVTAVWSVTKDRPSSEPAAASLGMGRRGRDRRGGRSGTVGDPARGEVYKTTRHQISLSVEQSELPIRVQRIPRCTEIYGTVRNSLCWTASSRTLGKGSYRWAPFWVCSHHLPPATPVRPLWTSTTYRALSPGSRNVTWHRRERSSSAQPGLPAALQHVQIVPRLVSPLRQTAVLLDRLAWKIRGCGTVTKNAEVFPHLKINILMGFKNTFVENNAIIEESLCRGVIIHSDKCAKPQAM